MTSITQERHSTHRCMHVAASACHAVTSGYRGLSWAFQGDALVTSAFLRHLRGQLVHEFVFWIQTGQHHRIIAAIKMAQSTLLLNVGGGGICELIGRHVKQSWGCFATPPVASWGHLRAIVGRLGPSSGHVRGILDHPGMTQLMCNKNTHANQL
jgi:hypothetical protein